MATLLIEMRWDQVRPDLSQDFRRETHYLQITRCPLGIGTFGRVVCEETGTSGEVVAIADLGGYRQAWPVPPVAGRTRAIAAKDATIATAKAALEREAMALALVAMADPVTVAGD